MQMSYLSISCAGELLFNLAVFFLPAGFLLFQEHLGCYDDRLLSLLDGSFSKVQTI